MSNWLTDRIFLVIIINVNLVIRERGFSMAEQKEVEMLLSMTKPRDKNSMLMAVNKINSGIGGVLRCLYRAEPDTLLTATDLI